MQIVIDCYGHHSTSVDFKKKVEISSCIDIKEHCIYVRYGIAEQKAAIHKISFSDSEVSHLWTWGNWSDRETLIYATDCMDALSVDLEA